MLAITAALRILFVLGLLFVIKIFLIFEGTERDISVVINGN